MEINENQGLTAKKTKNITSVTLDFTSTIASVFKIPTFRETVLVIICFSLLITLLQVNLFPRTLDIKVGQASPTDIYAPRDVVDPQATKLAQKEAVDRGLEEARLDPSYYRIDDSISKLATFNLNRFFELFDHDRQKIANKPVKIITKDDFPISKYQQYLYTPPKYSTLRQLATLKADLYQELKEKTHQILADVELNQPIDNETINKLKLDLLQIVDIHKVTPEIRLMVAELLETAIRPNLELDLTKIRKLEHQIRSNVPEVIHRQKQLLIAKNQVVTENDLKMLEDLHLIVEESNQVKVFLSLAFFVLFLVALSLVFIFQYHPELFKQERLLYLLLMLLLLIVGLIKVLSLTNLSFIPYLAPMSFAAMLVTILVNSQLALVLTAVVSILGGIIVEFNLAITIFYFISGVVSVFALHNFQRQRDLVRAGFILMASNTLVVVALNLLFRSSFSYVSVLLAIANGFLSAVLAIGSLPFLEHIFKITSPIRLLELSNPGHPLLRRLQIEAPGTYHHSIMVGNLAEAAAEGIGADALWVRVGSYYHDIGKIKRPYFFVENQFALDNPHEKLNPSLSTLIITYHVKEGAEIAKEHGLPDKLIEIIEQHHGTDLVRYFYKRATDNLQSEKDILIEEDFRYEGPKPQTKEAALVMLADSVEAAVKSLNKPIPSKVEALIQKIIRERLDDGQFDECNLTLKDLNNIKNSFLKVLGGMFHNRIEYPETVLKEMERKKVNADNNK